MNNNYFLPYQIRWLKDFSMTKIWEKSRRIGATYVQAYEDVTDCLEKKVPKVFFSSSDESAGREYIEYCLKWAKTYNAAAEVLGETFIDDKKDVKAYSIKFENGRIINALSSNPKQFRSKGGKVILDEFAWHNNPDELYSAAEPAKKWGFPLRILSTHNGKNSRFFRFIEEIKKGEKDWSLHTTPIHLAVQEGLVDKILRKKATKEEKENFIEQCRKDCLDENMFLQEYCCMPIDESTAFLPYELIRTCENSVILNSPITTGELYIGMDIGRKKDLTVIWGLEKLGLVKYTKIYKVLQKTPFKIQKEVLFNYLKSPNLRRACIDATGLGMQLAEEALENFGKTKIEAITFTNSVKEELAYTTKINFDDKTVIIPSSNEIREDLHSIKKMVTSSGHNRFDAESSNNQNGHADRFWALALALHAANNKSTPLTAKQIRTRKKHETYGYLQNY